MYYHLLIRMPSIVGRIMKSINKGDIPSSPHVAHLVVALGTISTFTGAALKLLILDMHAVDGVIFKCNILDPHLPFIYWLA